MGQTGGVNPCLLDVFQVLYPLRLPDLGLLWDRIGYVPPPTRLTLNYEQRDGLQVQQPIRGQRKLGRQQMPSGGVELFISGP